MLAALFAVAGCGAPPLQTPPPPVVDPCLDLECSTQPLRKSKVDVLFVLDDGPTMGGKLAALRAALAPFVAALDEAAQGGTPVSYHLGVVTADLGAGPQANAALGCRPGGDGGKLRLPAGAGGGVQFIEYDQIDHSANVADVASALVALGDVGTAGCDFRHPLEASYRALHDPIPENAGFLRSDAILAVVFVSDADDCSAPPTTDLFDPSASAYGPLDRFRCTQFGIACNGQPVPPMPVSGLTGCTSYDVSNGGKLTDLDTYIHFFTSPAAQGGVKVDPSDVILVGLVAPRDPVGVTITSPCAADASLASCPTLDHSCVAPDDVTRFGDPAVRTSLVVASARNHLLTSICDADDTTALGALAALIRTRTALACLSQPVAMRVDGTPDCVVEDVTANPDGSTTTTEIASCAENGHATPCWQLVDHLGEYDSEGCANAAATCTLSPSCQPVINPLDGSRQLYTVAVDRGTNAQPPATVTQSYCATVH